MLSTYTQAVPPGFARTLLLKEDTTMLVFAHTRTTAQLGAYLDDIIFPCSRTEILRCAEDNEAPDVILDAIEDLPERRYWSVKQIVTCVTREAS